MNEEIYYLVAYEKSSGKWRSADEMLGYLVSQATGGTSPVHFINDDGEPEWRNLSDGLETDTDAFSLIGSLDGLVFLRGPRVHVCKKGF